MEYREIRHFHLFCGLGGGAKGFNKATPRVGNLIGKFRCIGGIDVDAAAIRDFERLSGCRGTVLDLFDRDQYRAFHGAEPPLDWREATPADIQRAAGNERPHVVFLSAPCKGFSGLLPENRSRTAKYQALNRLTLRGIWLMLEAFGDDPPELIVFENVPRIASRGRALIDQIIAVLENYGYAVAETTHDCGEIGGLAQSRKRFLLVARHVKKVPPFLYEPEKKRLQAVGTVLDRMPLPGDPAGGPMHRIPNLQWKTWVRLAFVEAGSDWRSLNRLAVENGHLRDFLIVPEMHNGTYGVRSWNEPAGTVAGASRPGNGSFAIADPRTGIKHNNCFRIVQFDQAAGTVTGGCGPSAGGQGVADPRFPADGQYGQLGVRRWDESTGTITGQRSPIQGGFSVADPRRLGTHFGKYAVTPWDKAAGTVISGSTTGQGAFSVADPRHLNWRADASTRKLAVTPWAANSGCITGAQQVASGALAVADPRPNGIPVKGDHYLTGGHYGVVRWQDSSGAISAAACHDNGRWSVADPRMPEAADKLVAIIRSCDGTWHRPFTTLEMAAMQSLLDPEEYLELDGLSDTAWRERIGNAVPPDAAQAIAEVMGTTLLLAWSGETFVLSTTPIWVRPIAIALSLELEGV